MGWFSNRVQTITPATGGGLAELKHITGLDCVTGVLLLHTFETLLAIAAKDPQRAKEVAQAMASKKGKKK